MTRTRACCAALALALLSLLPATPALAAGDSRTLTYRILMGDDPIGTETVTIERQGPRTRVTVEASTRVTMLFITFRYDHKREELWEGGTLVSVTTSTDDDGTPHRLELRRAGAGFRLTADGKDADLPADALPLTLWTPAVLKHPLLLSVIDGSRYRVAARPVGRETVEAAGRKTDAQHHRIDGDVERDLWYADDGTLLMTRFRRSGYDITYALK
ncbi:DUF3108 domain-containing protein [Azospirillum sp. RWY-5-1]|uniref:DUF3108 domain-containing protein n=1 Tax=Azospirillum oleiclasticum TaxID=2735135 RepID=A0ABX2TCH6_9PROT|nr:DUF6134 family protein [Azospirillum oleiclasticum]NYZ15688.1 DUF3108 domain-containing protein [Azospirillum oleiclasticum]NYZ21958.1 DUF3108 domain-containing protein [Azospirillum oleiclasticum]